jgi:hypothetical protein
VVLAMAVGSRSNSNLVGTSEETRSPAHTNAHTIFGPTEILLSYTDTPARMDGADAKVQQQLDENRWK